MYCICTAVQFWGFKCMYLQFKGPHLINVYPLFFLIQLSFTYYNRLIYDIKYKSSPLIFSAEQAMYLLKKYAKKQKQNLKQDKNR